MTTRYAAASLLVCVVLAVAVPTPAAAGAGDSEAATTLRGVAIPMTDVEAAAVSQRARRLANDTATDLPRVGEHGFFLFTGERLVAVLTEADSRAGLAVVTGVRLDGGSTGYDVVVARNLTVRTEGDRTERSAVVGSLPTYARQLIQVQGPLRQLGVTLAGRSATTWGVVGDQQSDAPLLEYPGRKAEWAATLGANDAWREDVRARVGRRNNNLVTIGTGSHFWVNAPATVDGIVLPNASAEPFSGRGALLVTNVSVDAHRVDGPRAVRETATRGDVVTFTTGLVGARLDARALVERATDERYGNLSVPNGIATSVVLHGGVLFSGAPDSRRGVVPYAALENRLTNTTREGYRGRYRVTGRVVDADRIDPRLPDGNGLLVYDLERVGSLRANRSVAADVARWRSETVDVLASQTTMTYGEWVDVPGVDLTPGLGGSNRAATSGVRVERARLSVDSVRSGVPVEVTATLNNTADEPRTRLVRVHGGGTMYSLDNVTVPANATLNVTLRFAVFAPGSHDIRVGARSAGRLEVRPAATGTSTTAASGQSGFGVVAAALALLLAVAALRRRG